MQMETMNVMPSRAMLEEVTDDDLEDLLNILEEQEEPMHINELAEEMPQSKEKVRAILYRLIDQGYVASTPDWKYRSTDDTDPSAVKAG